MPAKAVLHFAIVVQDLDKALSFYTETLGFTLERRLKLPQPALEIAFIKLGSQRLELQHAEEPQEFHRDGVINNMTLLVDNLDESVRQLELAGGEVLSEKFSLPGGGSFCFCLGPNGEVIEFVVR